MVNRSTTPSARIAHIARQLGLVPARRQDQDRPVSAFTTRPEIRGSFGVVASTHWIASQVAMGVLERGGNAFDAAAAGAFVLQVVEPHLNGPGGEAPILLWSEKERRLR